MSVFSPNTGKCRPEKTPYLHTFHVLSYFILIQGNQFPYATKKLLNSEVYRVLHDACKKEVVKVYVKFI